MMFSFLPDLIKTLAAVDQRSCAACHSPFFSMFPVYLRFIFSSDFGKTFCNPNQNQALQLSLQKKQVYYPCTNKPHFV